MINDYFYFLKFGDLRRKMPLMLPGQIRSWPIRTRKDGDIIVHAIRPAGVQLLGENMLQFIALFIIFN